MGLGSRNSGWTNTGEPIADVGGTAANRQITSLHPSSFILHPCVPNPFNAITTISYQLSADSRVNLRIFDTTGQLVQTLVNGWRDAGWHEVTFDASHLPSGIYFARLKAGDYAGVRKVILLK